MTLMFGFTSRTDKTSFLGADDLEPTGGRREAKVHFLFKRFLVGGVGNNVPAKAASLLTVFEGETTYFADNSSFSYPSSIEKVCDLIAQQLPIIAAVTHATFNKLRAEGKRSSADAEFLKQPGFLYIIDTAAYHICQVTFDAIYPPREMYGYEIRELTTERLWRFGINDPTDRGLITREMRKYPFAWCAREIEEGKSELMRAGHDIRIIGNLGACYLVCSGNVTRRCIFPSLKATASYYYQQD